MTDTEAIDRFLKATRTRKGASINCYIAGVVGLLVFFDSSRLEDYRTIIIFWIAGTLIQSDPCPKNNIHYA